MRRTAVLIAVSALALTLTACGKPADEAPGGMDAPPPADAPAAEPAPAPASFDANFGARGTEPFWRLDAKGGEMTLTRPDAEPVVARITGAAVGAKGGTYTGDAAGTPLILTAGAGDCSDGMSDLKYAFTAEVTYGDLVLKGCGFDLAAEPREGQ
jgi:uncharacterized membrane protein